MFIENKRNKQRDRQRIYLLRSISKKNISKTIMDTILPGINKKVIHGKEIISISYSHLNDEEAISLATSLETMILQEGKSNLLLIVDIEHAPTSPSVFNKLKEISNTIDPFIKMRCVTGVEGVKKMLLTFYNKATKKGARPVNSIAEGLTYLTSIS